MRRFVVVAAVTLVALFALSRRGAGAPGAAPASPDPVARGEYIANHVAMCVECHSPRDKEGNLIREKLFRGAPVPVSAPPFPGIDWASQAPDITGLVGYDDEVDLLMTGIVARTGKPARRPMPPFRMSREDAGAVVAYLKTLR